MDYIGATPQANPLLGLLAERLKQAQEFAAKPFGYSNPPAEMIMNLLGVPAVQKTAERLAYGEPLTTGRGMTTQIRPETVEAALTVAPVAGLLGKGAETAAMAAGRAGERYAEKVVPQIMERGGLTAQLLGDLSQGSIRPIDVWHGSPYRFEKFDPTKIGSGEGAQAFSYGHYFGEARGTGEQYRDVLKQKQFAKIVEKGRNDFDVIAPDGTVLAEGVYRGAAQKAYDAFNKEAGNLYKVDLPDEAIANMLDWNKPVSKQPNVMKALRSEAEQRVRANKLADIENDIRSSLPSQDIGDDYLSMFSDANVGKNQEIQSQALEKLNKMDLKPLIDKELDNMKPVDMNWNMTGKEFYELLSSREGSPEKASGLLQRQGVPGTRYLDAGSRTPGGSDTSNFVVFPGGEDLLTIKEINDKPVGGLLGQSKAAFTYPQEEAMSLAQQRAALPKEQGGLGLSANNTAEERAAAMGIKTDAFHGSKQDITGPFKAGYEDNLAFVTQSPEFASKWIGKGKLQSRTGSEAEIKAAEDMYRQIKYKNTDNELLSKLEGEEFNAAYDKMSAAARAEQQKEFGLRGTPSGIHDTVYPVKVQANKTFNPETNIDVMSDYFKDNNISKSMQELFANGNYMAYENPAVVSYLKSKGFDSMRLRESSGDNFPTIAVFDPETVRSRFAAFDPWRRTSAIAAAMGVAAPDLLAEEQKPKKKKSLID